MVFHHGILLLHTLLSIKGVWLVLAYSISYAIQIATLRLASHPPWAAKGHGPGCRDRIAIGALGPEVSVVQEVDGDVRGEVGNCYPV
jgi:hypothetical protein